MKQYSLPAYLYGFQDFSAVEIVGKIQEKTDNDGTQKHETWTGENRAGWVVPVELTRGVRQKRLPNGKILQTLDTETIKITVWAHEKPVFQIGDYVTFSGLAVGAFASTRGAKMFFQATGIEPVAQDFSLDFEGK